MFFAKLNVRTFSSPMSPLLAQSYGLNYGLNSYYTIILYSTVFNLSEQTGVLGTKLSKNEHSMLLKYFKLYSI